MSDGRDHGSLDDAVDEQFAGDAAQLRFVERALNQESVGGADAQLPREPQIGRRGGHGRAGPIRLSSGRVDVNFPQHLESNRCARTVIS